MQQFIHSAVSLSFTRRPANVIPALAWHAMKCVKNCIFSSDKDRFIWFGDQRWNRKHVWRLIIACCDNLGTFCWGVSFSCASKKYTVFDHFTPKFTVVIRRMYNVRKRHWRHWWYYSTDLHSCTDIRCKSLKPCPNRKLQQSHLMSHNTRVTCF